MRKYLYANVFFTCASLLAFIYWAVNGTRTEDAILGFVLFLLSEVYDMQGKLESWP